MINIGNNFGEIEMCLNEKLRFNIKIKSRSCELFVLKKNDFLRLSVNFKEFIESFLHKSLIVYLKYNEERKKIIEQYEEITNKINHTQSINSTNSIILNRTNNNDVEVNNISKEEDKRNIDSDNNTKREENEDKSFEESAITENNITKSISDEKKKKKLKEFLDSRNIKNNLTKKPSFKHLGYLQKKSFSDNNINSIFNFKFQKKIDSILDYLEVNKVAFPNNTDNPKKLLEELKYETNIDKREEKVNKMEEILKQIYNE